MNAKLNLPMLLLIAASCLLGGCDFGTYGKRLNEKKPTPVAEPAEDGSNDQDSGDEDDSNIN